MENLPTYRLTQSGPEAQEILDQVNVNTIDIEQLKRLYQALNQSEPEIIEPTDTWPVANPEENVIYRVIDRVNTPPESYSDYMWNGTSMILMATYNNAIDNEPTANSNNLVKSGGVYSFVHANGGAYDISAAHAVGGVLATYDDLADALGANGANVPAAVRKGGMSIKFVLSSDSKYVQYRLMANTFSTTVSDWQGVDNVPITGSDNLVNSGGVYFSLSNTRRELQEELNRAVESIIPIEITGDVTNAPDEEDLTSVNVGGTDVIRFKDKLNSPLTYSGLGRVYLRKNMVNGVNVLTQEMISEANTIYIIQYDYNLDEESITIPENCILEFDGGSVNNGSVVFDNTAIESSKPCFIDCNISGTLANDVIKAIWFNIVADSTDKGETFRQLFTLLKNGDVLEFDKSQQFVIGNKGGTITKSNVTIRGINVLVHDNRTIISVGGTTAGSPKIENITIKDCVFSASDDSRNVIVLYTVDKVVVQNCKFDHIGYCIVQQHGFVSNDVTVSNCVATNCVKDFVEANCTGSAPSSNWKIIGNEYHGDLSYPNWAAEGDTEHRFCGFTAVTDVVVSDNFVENSGKDSMLHFEDVGNNVIVTNNVMKNAVGIFIWILNNNYDKVIISNNIMEITDDNCVGKGSYKAELYAPDFLSLVMNVSNVRNNNIIFSNNICKGLIKDGICRGRLDGRNVTFNNNTFINIAGILSIQRTKIINNYFWGCDNAARALTSSTSIIDFEYSNNIDIETKEYTIALSPYSATQLISQPIINNNIVSGNVYIDSAQNLIIRNNVFNAEKSIIYVKGTKKAPTILQDFNNVYKNGILTDYQQDIKKTEDGFSTDSFDLNRIKFVFNENGNAGFYNGDYLHNFNRIIGFSSSPIAQMTGDVYYDTTYKKLLRCDAVGNKQRWTLNISGTAEEDGTLTFTLNESTPITKTININSGDTAEIIKLRIGKICIPYMIYKASIGLFTFINSLPSGSSGYFTMTKTGASGITASLTYTQYATASKWKDVNGYKPAPSSGDTRPTMGVDDIGYQFFDTTLNKPIYWTGTAWVDATGATVS